MEQERGVGSSSPAEERAQAQGACPAGLSHPPAWTSLPWFPLPPPAMLSLLLPTRWGAGQRPARIDSQEHAVPAMGGG